MISIFLSNRQKILLLVVNICYKELCDLLDIEKNLYTKSSNDNNLTEFINKYKEDNKKSREINYKILSQIENTEKIIEGKIKDLETRKDTIIYFVRKGREIIKLTKNDYIHRNIYSKNRNNLNVVLKGYVIDIEGEKIKIKLSLEDIINNIMDDNIMLEEHKRINIYGYIFYTNDSNIKLLDSEPIIRRSELNEDPQKIKEFINILLNLGFKKLKDTLADKFDIKKYKDEITIEEILYTYEEYRFLEKLDDIFTKKIF